MDATVTAKEIANIADVSRQAIEKRAKKEAWPYVEITARGGIQKRYVVSSLPADIKAKLVRHQLGTNRDPQQRKTKIAHSRPGLAAGSSASPADPPEPGHLPTIHPTSAQAIMPPKVRTLLKFQVAQSWNREVALARLAFLELIQDQCRQVRSNKTERIKKLIDAYNNQVITAMVSLPDDSTKDAFSVLGSVSAGTYYRWRKAFETDGMDGLLTDFGKSAGDRVPEAIKQEVLKMLFERPRKASKIYDYLEIAFPREVLPSSATVGRLVKRLRAEYAEQLMYLHDGESKWKSKHQLCLGDADEDVQAPNDQWQIDSSPADVITKEGRRQKIVALIDVKSRRAKAVLWEKGEAWSIAQTLRAGFLEFGIPKKLKKDNGLDYQSKLVNQICADLGIEIPKLPP